MKDLAFRCHLPPGKSFENIFAPFWHYFISLLLKTCIFSTDDNKLILT